MSKTIVVGQTLQQKPKNEYVLWSSSAATEARLTFRRLRGSITADYASKTGDTEFPSSNTVEALKPPTTKWYWFRVRNHCCKLAVEPPGYTIPATVQQRIQPTDFRFV